MLSLDWRIIGAIAFLWCDIAVLIVCFAAVGVVPPLAVIVLAYQIGYLSNFVPIPGGIGVLDGSLVGMFVLYKTSATLATAATVVYHAIALWIPAMWGTLAFVILRRTRDRPITLRPPREARRRLREQRRRPDDGMTSEIRFKSSDRAADTQSWLLKRCSLSPISSSTKLPGRSVVPGVLCFSARLEPRQHGDAALKPTADLRRYLDT